MDPLDFLELCATGDEGTVRKILSRKAVDINYQHGINGWTALHWASKRGHRSLVEMLLQNGADQSLRDTQGRTAGHVTKDSEIARILGVGNEKCPEESVPDEDKFLPNYLRHPVFPHLEKSVPIPSDPGSRDETRNLLLKIPTNSSVEAFTQIEVPIDSVELFKKSLAHDLKIDCDSIDFVLRSADRVVLRSENDLKTLENGGKIEVILRKKYFSKTIIISTGTCLVAGFALCLAFAIRKR